MQLGRPAKRSSSGDIGLFSTDTSVVAVKSPIKVRILQLVSGGPVHFDQIVESTGKAKSTVSVHIRDLEEAGLVTMIPDPRDNRKRLVSLSSDTIGRLTNLDRDAGIASPSVHYTPGEFHSHDEDIAAFFRFCVLTFRTQAMIMGINLDPVLQRTGETVGQALAPQLSAGSIEEVIRVLDAFWNSHRLGRIVLTGTDPVTLEVRGCFECENLPVTGHGACSFDTGVLSAVFSHHFGLPVTVVEDQCYSSGSDHCRFVITPFEGNARGQDPLG